MQPHSQMAPILPFGQKNAARGVLDVRTNLARIRITLKPGFQVQGSQSARMTAVLTRFPVADWAQNTCFGQVSHHPESGWPQNTRFRQVSHHQDLP